MHEIQTLTFEDGLARIVQSITAAKTKPFIVSIHGIPNSGKTELTRRTKNALSKNEIHGVIEKDDNSEQILNRYTHLFCEEPVYIISYVIFECLEFTETVRKTSEELFGRTPDLSVYIAKEIQFDPLLEEQIAQKEYDFLIQNPKAKRKIL